VRLFYGSRDTLPCTCLSLLCADALIKIAAQEEDAIAADGNFTQAGDLAKHGMHTTIWTTARKPIDESNLYKFVQLATYAWFDERLKRICKASADH
jgi:hypothetical protein